tara:strand:+ start:284 stop:1216 length:933 start_codon:yes stop_codon:yes gene_type:complete
MRNTALLGVFVLCLSNIVGSTELKSEIKNNIVAKVGNSLITSIDLQNEVVTNLVINKKEITQANIDGVKNYAIKNLVKKSIKKIEINKYKIEEYSKKDLYDYIDKTAKSFETNKDGLKKIFKINNINYDQFVESYKIELLWNTMIFKVYNKQININIIAVENEIEKVKNSVNLEYNLSEIEIPVAQYNESKFKEISKVIKNEGFEIAAKKFSVSSTAVSGGLVGWVSAESLSNKYTEQLKKINVQEMSEPILNENSMLIFKINKIKKDNNEFNSDVVRKKILIQKREEKLNLFSRSHFSNLENSITIKFQ